MSWLYSCVLKQSKGLERCGLKVKLGNHICTPKSVGAHTFPSGLLGSWNSDGFSNFQRVISGIKIHCIKKFFIPSENSWDANVLNGFTWPNQIFITQLMAKRRAKNQSANFIPDH
jgi:hypothetical protein